MLIGIIIIGSWLGMLFVVHPKPKIIYQIGIDYAGQQISCKEVDDEMSTMQQ